MDRNPIVRATPPGVRSREIVPPTPAEVRTLLDACKDANPDLASLIYMAVTTGCRRGELCGLRCADVDMEEGTVLVARSISDADGVVEVKDTKTHQARRLALDPSTVEVLRRHRSLAVSRAETAGVRIEAFAYVWSQDIAATVPWRPDRVTGAFRVLTERHWRPNRERCGPSAYFTAMMSTVRMSGSLANRSAATWPKAAGICPPRWAWRASSVSKESKIP